MSIVVNFNNSKTEISPSEACSTWGGLTQQFVDTSLLHPPRLLQLLTSLHPDGRLGTYLFRCGDGYSTLIKPNWCEDGLNSRVDIDAGGTCEANVSLKPKSGPLSKVDNLQTHALPEDTKKKLEVDLYIERVGTEGEFGLLPFPMTQTPFPLDDNKANVLKVWEHGSFDGVVDRFSLERASDGETGAAVASGTKRRASAPAASSGKKQKNAGASDEDGAKKKKKAATPKKSAAAAAAATGDDKGKERKSPRKAAAAKEPAKPAEEAPATPSKKKKDAAKEKSSPKKKSPKKETSSKMEPEPPKEDETKKSPKKKKEEEEEEKPSAGKEPKKKEEKVKRPLSGYMRFAGDVRPKIMKENPEWKITEVTKKIGKDWRELPEHQKEMYKREADEAMVKFRSEYPNLPKSTRKKKERKKAEDERPAVMEEMDDDVGENKVAVQAVAIITQEEGGGEEADGNGSAKNGKGKKRHSSGGRHATDSSLSHIPAEPAPGLPDGWTTRVVPRSNGKGSDKYFFSPAKSYKFRAKTEIKRFQASLEEAGGDEEAAIELYSRGERERNSAKKGKKKKAASAGDDDGNQMPAAWEA